MMATLLRAVINIAAITRNNIEAWLIYYKPVNCVPPAGEFELIQCLPTNAQSRPKFRPKNSVRKRLFTVYHSDCPIYLPSCDEQFH
ncbi:hypothetical protein ALQ08_200131 [Pseudomonas syringae pv. delphinii]|uniref:Uncharacterized protein n=1 Tax=Pseudomonas syringae pv. delphinii TaxID=192088 RepID=A0A0P9QPH7_9PSED|nr:hypothetical protein ALO72_200051 [Pseudomonas syringae pv. delphinii]RMP07204.1 hypothetical protein ALQ28_200052 [Pseudomonas syringae pv. delphinii]RMP18602.1 hypothetical protein ALQ27_200102 [Pseudomonas syringae pv. delphinii]RMQ21229.1 hypothetical protein ALQ08_200131 [Pseudomonas syringae pv. delphinii]